MIYNIFKLHNMNGKEGCISRIKSLTVYKTDIQDRKREKMERIYRNMKHDQRPRLAKEAKEALEMKLSYGQYKWRQLEEKERERNGKKENGSREKTLAGGHCGCLQSRVIAGGKGKGTGKKIWRAFSNFIPMEKWRGKKRRAAEKRDEV
ncbi:MAG: hypothetical protein Q4G07_09895 [Oscillospiraceae bacterium]|nr:hypothetical protein [Oscillospiraceae bacterium]